MEYFTKEWCFSDLEEHVIEERLKNYNEYINNVYKKLPFVLKVLVKSINLHDGIIKNAFFAKTENFLILKGVFGDLQTGYFSLEIKYLKTQKLKVDALISVFENQKIEILSDEIEFLSEGNYSHKILFSTQKEIEIFFGDIEISICNVTSDSYKYEDCHLEIK